MKLKAVKTKQNSDIVRYKFEGDITIYTVRKLKKLLMKDLEKNTKLEFDFQKIDKFDSAGFQLIEYMSNIAEKEGKEIQITQRSDSVSRIYDLYGTSI
ncbi:MAG: STAS domain-containing protein [Spirochaetes bacterium]|nr:STAS domain-containing protein [Spirochaetota bacterium]